MIEAAPSVEKAHSLALGVYLATAATPDEHALVGAVLARLYAVFDGRYDPLGCVREARGFVARLASGSVPPELDRALADAERWLVLAPHRAPLPRPERRYLGAEPALLDWERPLLLPASAETPAVREPEQPPTPAPDGFLADPLPALDSAAWTRERRADFFGEIGALATHRIPQLGEPWRGAAFAERRLLRNLDALLALDASTLNELESLAKNAPAPDPALLLGLTIVAGCLSGRDGLGACERVFRHFEEEPGFVDAFAEGLSLAPHPLVPGMMRELLTDPSASRRALGIAVLARRGEATVEELHAATHDDDLVSAEALVPFVRKCDPRTRDVLDEIERRVRGGASAALGDAFLLAASLAAHPYAQSFLGAATVAGSEFAARLFGLGAERADAERLLEWTASGPTPAFADALGWAGDPACLPLLIGLLRTDDEPLVLASASALERITGAGLRQFRDIPVEDVVDPRLDPDRPPTPVAPDPDPFPEATPDRIELPSTDPEAWAAYVDGARERLVPGVRTRRGAAYTPYVSFYELDQLPCSPSERIALTHEITLRTGLSFWFDVRAFVPAQERRLSWLREPIERRSSSPGSWDRPFDRTPLEPLR